MKSQYEPHSTTEHLGYLIEECGEVLAAAGKSLRWGLDSSNPELPAEQRETNEAWLRREMVDLLGAMSRMQAHLDGDRGIVDSQLRYGRRAS